jgi:hypothetical protein
MNEYIVEIKKGSEVTHVVVMKGDRKTPDLTVASATGYKYASKFKSKDRATKIAKKFEGGVVSPSFGGYVNSSKSTVAPIANKVNGAPAYRTI